MPELDLYALKAHMKLYNFFKSICDECPIKKCKKCKIRKILDRLEKNIRQAIIEE